MTKVYLVEEGDGSWEDKWTGIHSAYFDKDKADEVRKQLKDDWDKKELEIKSLYSHVHQCEYYYTQREENDRCELCDKFSGLQDELENSGWYSVREIDVM